MQPTGRRRRFPGSGRLTRRLALALVVVVVVVFAIGAGVGYVRERAQFERNLRVEALVLGNALARGMADVWAQNGQAAAFRFLGESSDERTHVRVRWVWVGDAADSPHAPATNIRALGDRMLMYRDEPNEVWYTYVPVRVPGTRRGALELRQSLAEQNAYLRESLRNNIIEAVLLAVVGTSIAFVLGVLFIGRPVRKLVEKARRVGAGDLTGPLVLTQNDELAELAEEMNRMCERLETEGLARTQVEAHLRHAERLTTVGKLASGLAHELGTPLNVVNGRGRLIASGDVDGEEARACGQIIVEQTERMTRLIRQLLEFARPRPPHKLRQPVVPMLERVRVLLGPMAKAAEVALEVVAPEPIALAVDEGQLQQVLTNLVVNAIQATPPGGQICLAVETVEAEAPPALGGGPQAVVAITVRDTGQGMDAATRARVFEPFFSTKDVGEGTGLGLSVSWGIVREHGGWIAVDSAPGHGTAFTVYLPSEVTGAVAGVEPVPHPPLRRGHAISQPLPIVGPPGGSATGDARPRGRALSSPPLAPLELPSSEKDHA